MKGAEWVEQFNSLKLFAKLPNLVLSNGSETNKCNLKDIKIHIFPKNCPAARGFDLFVIQLRCTSSLTCHQQNLSSTPSCLL